MTDIPRFVYVNPLIFLLIFYSWVIGKTQELFILYGVIIIHEISHIITAKHFKVEVEKILLTPIGIMAKMSNTSPIGYGKEIIIAAAGPISNLIMALGGYIINLYFLDNSKGISFFILANVSLFVLNILPVIPLDGGRIFKYTLLSNLGYRGTIKIFSILTKFIATALIILGIIQLFNSVYNLSLLFIGIFIYICMYREKDEMKFALIKELINKKCNEETYEVEYIIRFQNQRAINVIQDFFSNKINVIKVLDEQMNVLGEVTEKELTECLVHNSSNITFEEVLKYLNKVDVSVLK